MSETENAPSTTDATSSPPKRDALSPLFADSQSPVKAKDIASVRVYRQVPDEDGKEKRIYLPPKAFKRGLRISPWETSIETLSDALRPGVYYLQAVGFDHKTIGGRLIEIADESGDPAPRTIESSSEDDRDRDRDRDREARPSSSVFGPRLFESSSASASSGSSEANDRIERLTALVERMANPAPPAAPPSPFAGMEGVLALIDRMRPQTAAVDPGSLSERERFLEERLRAAQQECDRLRADLDDKRAAYRKAEGDIDDRWRDRIKSIEKDADAIRRDYETRIAGLEKRVFDLQTQVIEAESGKRKAEIDADAADALRDRDGYGEKSGLGRLTEDLGTLVKAAEPIVAPILLEAMKKKAGGA